MAIEKKDESRVGSSRSDRLAAIEAVTGNIEKQFGKGAIMRLGEGTALPEVLVMSTGSLALDVALGCGGLPRGRIVEVFAAPVTPVTS